MSFIDLDAKTIADLNVGDAVLYQRRKKNTVYTCPGKVIRKDGASVTVRCDSKNGSFEEAFPNEKTTHFLIQECSFADKAAIERERLKGQLA